jgi:hypothetical protein
MLAAGGVLLDSNGREPVYDDGAYGTSPRLFAGSKAVALELSSRNWDIAFRSERETSMPIVRLVKGRGVADPALLARAQGALLGHLLGSALWTLFAGPDSDGERKVLDLPEIEAAARRRRLFAGQLGPAGEVAVAAARSLVDLASDAKRMKRAYAAWVDSSPAFLDRATEAALKGQPLQSDLSAAALARVTPLALWAHDASDTITATKAREDAALTHPASAAGEAAAIMALALHSLLRGVEPLAVIDAAHAFARRSGFSREVIDACVESTTLPRPPHASDALSALRCALFHLRTAGAFEAAMESALTLDSASDATAAITGAVMGARLGREGISDRLRNLVLSCRPMEGLAPHPRPSTYWGTDAMAMAEALLTAR